ncbi:MAG: FapA family protein [candidate division Zixibacteria bacterium]|nr:FapA family protein [candidate division Zixibacteria bacterium]
MSLSTSTSTQTAKSSLVRIVIAKDSMTAMMAISKPSPGSNETTLDNVKEEIERVGLVYGIDWEAIDEALVKREWDTPVRIAAGTKPVKGNDAIFEYTFETKRDQAPEEDEDGRIDYRSLNFIQNVEEDQVLVVKTPPTDGVDGTSVRGTPVKAACGRDLPFQSGKNTKISEDDLSLIATTSGSIVLTRDGISVNDVTSIQGDVDMRVGNIDCAGSVIIGGQINAGFKVHVGGNLDVGGNVQDCVIDCKGNIVIKGGCFGKGEGNIKVGGDIILKFAEGLTIESGGNVTVGGELINCQVTAGGNVDICGKKGTIAGGAIYAGKEIRSSVAGSDAGTITDLYVAYDTEIMSEYENTMQEIDRVNADLKRVKETLYGLYRLQGDGKLDSDKEAILKQLEEFQTGAPDALKALDETKAGIEGRMQEFKDAQIVVKDTLYPGVIAHFGMVYREFTEQTGACKLTLEGGRVMVSEWREDRDGKH